jgi:hypothetical protein
MTSPYPHTDECLKAQAALEAFRRTWPDFCTKCGASGWWEWPGSPETPPDTEPCQGCLGDGMCPRCAAKLSEEALDAEVVHCGACLWRSDAVRGQEVAPEVNCECGWTDVTETGWVGVEPPGMRSRIIAALSRLRDGRLR